MNYIKICGERVSKNVARKIFESGRKRGQDEIYGNTHTYPDERSKLDFEQWWEEHCNENNS